MCAWLCGNKTLSVVVDLVLSSDFQNDYDVDHVYRDKMPLDLLGILSWWNNRKLDELYGKDKYHKLYNKKYIQLDVSDVQVHKSVCCYVYQTCGCRANDDELLFQLLKNWCDDHFDEYEESWETAEWNLDSPVKVCCQQNLDKWM